MGKEEIEKLINSFIKQSTAGLLISLCAFCFNSCTLLRPFPLQPIDNRDSIQQIEKSDLAKFNGNYEIRSVDSNSSTLDYTFTYKTLNNLKKWAGKNGYINLSSIDDSHLKASLFANHKLVKSKTVSGRINNNHFEFHTSHFSLKYVFISYVQQTNRLAFSKEGDLYLDTNRGGIGFLLIVPIPLSGSSVADYNLKFKRKN